MLDYLYLVIGYRYIYPWTPCLLKTSSICWGLNMIYVCVCICPVAFHNISRLSKVFKFCIERWIESYNLHFLCSPMENNFHFSTTNINHSSHQIPTFTNERKSVNIPKPTHFQNGDQMNISWNIKFCKKNIVSHSSHPIPLHPTQSHHWCFNVVTYWIYFWYRNNDEPKKLPGVDGRGLGW